MQRQEAAAKQQQQGGAEPESAEKKSSQEEPGASAAATEWEEEVESGGERYVLAHELAKQTGDRDAVRQELLNVFFAAHDSAAIALTSVMFDLARHPAVWARLREEVLGLGDAPVTFEVLKSLTYLKWVVNESKFAV